MLTPDLLIMTLPMNRNSKLFSPKVITRLDKMWILLVELTRVSSSAMDGLLKDSILKVSFTDGEQWRPMKGNLFTKVILRMDFFTNRAKYTFTQFFCTYFQNSKFIIGFKRISSLQNNSEAASDKFKWRILFGWKWTKNLSLSNKKKIK